MQSLSFKHLQFGILEQSDTSMIIDRKEYERKKISKALLSASQKMITYVSANNFS